MIKIIETKEEFLDAIKGNAIIDFYADWCGPCKMLAPILDKVAEKHKEIVIKKINVDQFNDIASEYGVSSIPNVVFYKDGKLLGRVIGLQSEETFDKTIADAFK